MIDPTIFEAIGVESATALDLILWRRYHRAVPGLLEATLALNPGLAALGPLIPRGIALRIPLDRPESAAKLPLVRLW